jgi:hypothetical protein
MARNRANVDRALELARKRPPLSPKDHRERVSILHSLSVEQLQMIEAEQRRAHPAVAAYPAKH